MLVGVVFTWLALRPIAAIIFAQAANGLLLPIVAGFLLYIANDRSLLGSRANGWVSNLLGGTMVLVAAALGIRSLVRALSGLFGVLTLPNGDLPSDFRDDSGTAYGTLVVDLGAAAPAYSKSDIPFVVKDGAGQKLAYVYYEEESIGGKVAHQR